MSSQATLVGTQARAPNAVAGPSRLRVEVLVPPHPKSTFKRPRVDNRAVPHTQPQVPPLWKARRINVIDPPESSRGRRIPRTRSRDVTQAPDPPAEEIQVPVGQTNEEEDAADVEVLLGTDAPDNVSN